MIGLPGGTSVSRLWVYEWEAADGAAGGSPHLHTASAEAYVVLHGAGAVETLSRDGFASTSLAPGSLLWFTPGTVHRLVNLSGDLELLVIMQNAGLPESGDAVLTLPPTILADPVAYRAAVTLNPVDPADSARRRRDLAVEGYLELRDRVRIEGATALAGLHAAAARLVADRVGHWRDRVESGPAAQLALTRFHLAALSSADPAHLAHASVHSAEAVDGSRYGMCGRLQVWPTAADRRTSNPR